MSLFICLKIWPNVEFRIGKYFTLEMCKYKTNFFWLPVLCSEISQLCALIKAVLSLCWPSVDSFNLATPCPSVVRRWFFSSFFFELLLFSSWTFWAGPVGLYSLVFWFSSFFSFFFLSLFFLFCFLGVFLNFIFQSFYWKEFKFLSDFQFLRASLFPRFL